MCRSEDYIKKESPLSNGKSKVQPRQSNGKQLHITDMVQSSLIIIYIKCSGRAIYRPALYD